MFNLGAGEVVLILVVALLVLGPKRLPELARGIGKFMREFRRQTDEVRSVVEREFYRMDQDLNPEPEVPEPQVHSILPVQAPQPPQALMAEASARTSPGIPSPTAPESPASGGAASRTPAGTVPARGGAAPAKLPGPSRPPEGA